MPAGFVAEHALMFMLLRPDAITRPAVAETIADHVARRVPIFLAIPGPEGFLPAQLFLNELVQDAVAGRDGAALLSFLQRAVDWLTLQGFEPVPQFT